MSQISKATVFVVLLCAAPAYAEEPSVKCGSAEWKKFSAAVESYCKVKKGKSCTAVLLGAFTRCDAGSAWISEAKAASGKFDCEYDDGAEDPTTYTVSFVQDGKNNWTVTKISKLTKVYKDR